ncbi:MAG TPA: Crp/Fnr family transcriptional regulator [Candidatus Brocadiia bacterium]|nr:cyclic nucleotide-binding domain-containing protein [Planctomycetota bacterium]MBI4007757.1 cyclic nucleotide-binding domain-containing protein [Planctomycetota bacterium]MDO8093369.1 cyclic nucleotide-binding domain-containing protein [Candidatus Brocadiales bacterium]
MSEIQKVFKEVGKEKVYKKGGILFKEGGLSKHMYFILSGGVRIFKKAGKKEVVFAEFRKGDFFGEMALLTDEHCRANAQVTRQSKISSIDKKTAEALLNTNPAFTLEIATEVIKRLQRADKFLIQAFDMAMTIDEKIVHSTKL